MKVLVAEDDVLYREKLRILLERWGYEAATCDNGVEAWQIMQEGGGPSLALLDCLMPEMDGIELCRKIRNREGAPYVYIVMLSSRSEKEDVVQGVYSGADDYVIKPFHPDELRARLSAGRRILELQQRLMAAQEVLRAQAREDSLTGLMNRRAISETLEQELARTRRAAMPLGVMMLDIDHFKQINDRYGHDAGDAVLREASERLQAVVRLYDSVGRWGGEEFVILMPGCDLPGMMMLAERVRSRIAESPMAAPKICVTISAGVASIDPSGHPAPDAILKAADNALYCAKSRGRNRVESATLEAA